MSARCPCGLPGPYEACCGRYHAGLEPDDAERLMRSRYAAFVRRDVAYLHRTLHPDHDDRGVPFTAFEARMRSHFASGIAYRGLEVLDATSPDDSGIARVLFVAKLAQRGKDRSFAELSSFAHDGTGLRYLAGITMSPASLPARSIAELAALGIR